MRLMKVLATLGVQTCCATLFVARSEHGLMADLLAPQSGCSPGCLGSPSQYVCGPKMAYRGATIVTTA